jgi:predicted DNA-binding ribbon-helix-helix protein
MALMVSELGSNSRTSRRKATRPCEDGIGGAPSYFFLGRPAMRSTVVKRSIVIAGHKTSVSLEDAFWKSLREIATGRGMTLSNLVTSIDVERQQGNLSSCLRLFVLDFYRFQLMEAISARTGVPSVVTMRPVKSA